MRKINILYISADMQLAGAQSVVLNLIKNLNKDRFKISICSLQGGILFEKVKKLGIEAELLGPKPIFDIKAIIKLVRLMKKQRVDIVHCHGFDPAYYGAISAKIAKVPICILNYHGRYWRQKKRRVFMTGLASKLSNLIIAVSEDLRADLVKVLKLSQEKIITIHNGIEMDRFSSDLTIKEAKEKLGFESDVFLIGNIANLRPVKGQYLLLQSAKKIIEKIPNVKFVLVGEGPSKLDLENLTKKLGLSQKIIFMGKQRDIVTILSALDIFVLPSLSEEISLALLEAMAMERPVVVTKVGGNPEIVTDGINGLLIPSKDENTLAQAIIKLLQNKNLALKLGESARLKIEEDFSLKVMVEKIEDLYEELINKKIK